MLKISFYRIPLAFLLSVLLLHTFAYPGDVTVLIEEFPPYEYVEDGQFKGVNIELTKEAFKRMGLEPRFGTRPWKRALLELEKGETMAVLSGFRLPSREAFAIFPSQHLAMETDVVIAHADSSVEIDSLEDLRGLTVGVVLGYTYGHELDSMKGLRKIETGSNPQLLGMLLKKRMDVILASRSVMEHLARKAGKLSEIRIVHEFCNEPLYLFFSRARGKEAEKLSHDFDKAVQSMHEDGIFQAIVDKY